MIVSRPLINRPRGLRSVIVYGPQGCGKTRNAEALRIHFGLSTVCEADEWKVQPPLTDALILTNATPPDEVRRKLSFEEAMARLQGPEGYPF